MLKFVLWLLLVAALIIIVSGGLTIAHITSRIGN